MKTAILIICITLLVLYVALLPLFEYLNRQALRERDKRAQENVAKALEKASRWK